MSKGLDVRVEAAPGLDGGGAPPLHGAGEQVPGPDCGESGHAVQDGGGSTAPLLGIPASDPPSYRRSLFRR